MDKLIVMILSANVIQILDYEGKVVKEGVNVIYIPTADLNPVKDSETSYGYVPITAFMPMEFIGQIEKHGGVPALAIAHSFSDLELISV